MVVGRKAPDFELPNQDGELVKLSSLRGKKVLLFMFPKADTGACTKQACGFRDAMPAIDAAGAVVLGLSPDPPEALRRWKDKENLPYDLLSDPQLKVLKKYRVWGEKSMYGNKYMGVIRSHVVIDEKGRLQDVQWKVTPAVSVAKGVKALAG